MSLLVHQDLVLAFIFHLGQIEEYPPEERERVCFRWEADDALAVQVNHLTFPSDATNADQLDNEAEAHHQYTCIIKVGEEGQQVGALGSLVCHRGSSCNFLGIHQHGIIVCQLIDGRLFHHPFLNIEQRVNERDTQEAEQGEPAPLEEGVALAKEFVESIEQGNACIYFQQINPFECHRCRCLGYSSFPFSIKSMMSFKSSAESFCSLAKKETISL